jgi:uncharacterized protein
VYAYHRAGLVEWRAVWPIGAASVVAALIGARLAILLPPEALKTGFGALLIFSGVRLLSRSRRADEGAGGGEPRLAIFQTTLTGVLVGLFAALLGVGGGIVAIPMLIHVIGLDIRQVAATSMGIIGVTSAAGALGYAVNGLGQPGLPPWSIGYVHLSAGVAMFLAALVSVRWGARLNQRLEPQSLALLFGTIFVLLGLRLASGNLLALLLGAGAAAGIG